MSKREIFLYFPGFIKYKEGLSVLLKNSTLEENIIEGQDNLELLWNFLTSTDINFSGVPRMVFGSIGKIFSNGIIDQILEANLRMRLFPNWEQHRAFIELLKKILLDHQRLAKFRQENIGGIEEIIRNSFVPKIDACFGFYERGNEIADELQKTGGNMASASGRLKQICYLPNIAPIIFLSVWELALLLQDKTAEYYQLRFFKPQDIISFKNWVLNTLIRVGNVETYISELIEKNRNNNHFLIKDGS